jgi:hypothetical protein
VTLLRCEVRSRVYEEQELQLRAWIIPNLVSAMSLWNKISIHDDALFLNMCTGF